MARTVTTRRHFLQAGASVGALAALAACGKGAGTTSSSSLRFVANGGDYVKGGFGQKQIAAFTAAHGTKVSIIDSAQHAAQLFFTEASTGNLPDLVFTGGAAALSLPTMLQKKWALSFEDLGIDIKSRFDPAMFVDGITTANGKTYSWFPRDNRGGGFLVYNTDMMKSAGLDPSQPPKTWDELISAAAKIRATNKNVYGIALPLKQMNGYAFLDNSLQNEHPGVKSAFDFKTGKYVHDTFHNDSIEVLQKLKKSGTLHPNCLSLDANGSDGYFTSGRVAFALTGPWLCNVYHTAGFTSFGVTTGPTLSGSTPLQYDLLAASGFFATTSTKNKTGLRELVDWLTRPDFLKGTVQTSYNPVGNDAINQKYAPSDQVKTLSSLQQKVIRPPVPQSNPTALKVKLAESAAKPPAKDWWQVAQGTLAGRVPNYKQALSQVNDDYNERFDAALSQVKASRSLFVVDWDGTSDYTA